ncbi:MAG: dienelactone hydrolase family protein [Actinobacteria bacterium]|nr:dienelactone hydrolase family protein [Actinomycetota bacterium]
MGGEVASPLTLLLLHGTGGDERQLLDLGRVLAPDATLLGVRGNAPEGGTNRWFARIPAPGTAYGFRLDTADLARRADDLAEFVRDRVADPSAVVAVGFSNGANILAAVMLRHPDVLRAGILAAPMPGVEAAGPLASSAVLLIGGRHDPIATPEEVEALAAQLTDAGAAVEVAWHEGGHDLPPHAVEAAVAWLTKWRAAVGLEAGPPLP